MRRSEAPSMRNKSNDQHDDVSSSTPLCSKDSDLEEADKLDDGLLWSCKNEESRSGTSSKYIDSHRRIFNIVWRDISTRKHKTWKGDGTLEVDMSTGRAVLKDDSGKYMGCTSKWSVHDIQTDQQLVVSGKEIQLLEEVRGIAEILALRKRQVCNRSWGTEEYTSSSSEPEPKKSKGAFLFRPNLILKTPLLLNQKPELIQTQTTDSIKEMVNEQELMSNLRSKAETCPSKGMKEYICLLRCSELQHYLLRKVAEFFGAHKNEKLNAKSVEMLDLVRVLKEICTHPSFVAHKSTSNRLIQYLTPSLPDWPDMGPFESAKLEFVQYFLAAAVLKAKGHCVLVAYHESTLNMLQGLCDFMHLKCMRLNTSTDKESLREVMMISLDVMNDSTAKILILSAILWYREPELINKASHVIVFEDVPNVLSKISPCLRTNDNLHIYSLITAASIEEFSFERYFINDDNSQDYHDSDLEELLSISSCVDPPCYTHIALNCSCSGDGRNIYRGGVGSASAVFCRHFQPPYGRTLLKDTMLANASDNIVYIFTKQ